MASPPMRQRRTRTAGVTPASFTAPILKPLIAETGTTQAALNLEVPPPGNGYMLISRTNRQLWYSNGGSWLKCAI